MKKYLSIIMMFMTIVFLCCACGAGSDSTDNTDSTTANGFDNVDEVNDAEDILACLEEKEFKQVDNGYELTLKDDGVCSVYTMSAEGNNVKFKGVMDFGEDNSMMLKTIKDEPESMLSIPAEYLIHIVNNSGNESIAFDYEFYVKDAKASEGTLNVKDALKIVNDYDD